MWFTLRVSYTKSKVNRNAKFKNSLVAVRHNNGENLNLLTVTKNFFWVYVSVKNSINGVQT